MREAGRQAASKQAVVRQHQVPVSATDYVSQTDERTDVSRADAIHRPLLTPRARRIDAHQHARSELVRANFDSNNSTLLVRFRRRAANVL